VAIDGDVSGDVLTLDYLVVGAHRDRAGRHKRWEDWPAPMSALLPAQPTLRAVHGGLSYPSSPHDLPLFFFFWL
jgi:hypothetical protein